jgi:hypothetical protein
MAKPHAVVRKAVVLAKFIPVGLTTLDDLIERGLLETVPLSESGRAKAVTMRSIIAYQRDHMGLEPLADDEPSGGESIFLPPRRKRKAAADDKPNGE